MADIKLFASFSAWEGRGEEERSVMPRARRTLNECGNERDEGDFLAEKYTCEGWRGGNGRHVDNGFSIRASSYTDSLPPQLPHTHNCCITFALSAGFVRSMASVIFSSFSRFLKHSKFGRSIMDS